MTKPEFHQLLQRYLQGECNKEEILKIHKWFSHLERDSDLILNAQEKNALEHKLWDAINEQTLESDEMVLEVTTKKWWQSTIFYSSIAASIPIILVCVLYFILAGNSTTSIASYSVFEETTELESQKNTTVSVQKIILQDQSIVLLSPNSSISYPKKFKVNKREVHLTGDAFFKVSRNPQKPFLVYTGTLVTQVLGTSFWIKTQAHNKAIEVEVSTGKVSVYENEKTYKDKTPVQKHNLINNGVILTPNQKVVFFEEDKHWVTGLVEKPVEVNAIQVAEKLVYNDTPLLDILNALENRYGIEIVSAGEKLGTCTFTGDITEMSLYEKLDLVCRSVGATYEVKGTRILIAGDGCE